jgi:hypothetical protein
MFDSVKLNKEKKMKKLGLISCAILSIALMSCGGASNVDSNAKGFTALQDELKSEFGENAYYTELSIVNIESIGKSISATVTKEPASLKLGEWNYSQNNWKQSAEITIEISEGSAPEDFMFQLDDKINLTKLGELVEKSKAKLTEEKQIENPRLSMAFIKIPRSQDISKAEYSVSLEPENGGTSFSFYYKLDGELIKMDY